MKLLRVNSCLQCHYNYMGSGYCALLGKPIFGSVKSILPECPLPNAFVPTQLWRCKECGSYNVSTLAWVKINSNEFDGYYDDDAGENDYCHDCSKNVILLTEEEYEKIKER